MKNNVELLPRVDDIVIATPNLEPDELLDYIKERVQFLYYITQEHLSPKMPKLQYDDVKHNLSIIMEDIIDTINDNRYNYENND